MTPARDQLRLTWRKSTYSEASGSCVELGGDGRNLQAFRDGKDPGGPVLRVAPGSLASFVEAVERGTYD